MKGLDINILIRFLTKDDEKQAENKRHHFFVSNFTLIETVWVLNKLYECTNKDISNAFKALLSIPIINFESDLFILLK